jgi:hypothetical protein
MTKADPKEAEDFARWVRRAKRDELMERLVSLSDSERRKYAKAVAKAWRKAHPDRWSGRDHNLDLALISMCSWTDAKRFRLARNFTRRPDPTREDLYRAFAARRPDWIDRWVERELSVESWAVDWPFIRDLVREGVCGKPSSDDYIVQMVACRLGSWRSKRPLVEVLKADPGLLEDEIWRTFEVDPQGGNLFHNDEAQWAGEHKELSWGAAFVELAREGVIDRQRLLQSVVGTLRAGIQLKGTAFHVRLHENLKPSLEEAEELSIAYLDLLNHPVDAVAKFGLRQLSKLAKAERVNPQLIIDRIPSSLTRATKGPAVTSLRLLRNVVKSDLSLALSAAIAATCGMTHPRSDVQEEAISLISDIAPEVSTDLAAALMENLTYLAPSQRSRVDDLISRVDPASKPAPSAGGHDRFEGGGDPTPPERDGTTRNVGSIVEGAQSICLQARELTGLQALLDSYQDGLSPHRVRSEWALIPRLDEAKAVSPIYSLDELIDTLLALLENAEDQVEVERALDGLARLTAQRPKDLGERTSSLLQRAKKPGDGMGDYSSVAGNIAALVRSWLEGSPVSSKKVHRAPGPEAFMVERFCEVERRVRSKRGLGLLSLPTHSSAWIDPVVLVRRLEEDLATPTNQNTLDFTQALLRMAPDNRPRALEAAADLKGEFGAVLRFALGGQGPVAETPDQERGWFSRAVQTLAPRPKSADHKWSLWIAAARAREPFGEVCELSGTPVQHEAFAVRRPAFDWEISMPKKSRWDTDPVLRVTGDPPFQATAPVVRPLEGLCTRRQAWAVADARFRYSIWPMDAELISIGGCTAMCERLFRPASTFSPTATFLEPLFDPDLPFAELPQVMLCLALVAQDADARLMGLEVAVTLVADGRADGRELGKIYSRLFETKGLVKLNRVGSAVEHIANAGAVQQLACCRLLEEFIGSLEAVPRDLHHLLSPYRELLVATGRASDPRTHDVLRTIKGSGKTAKLAKLIIEEHGNESRARDHLLKSWAELLKARSAHAEVVQARLREN